MSFIKKLQTNINKITQGYFANWTPDMPISVGDYGYINGYRFTRDGNISRYIANVGIESVRLETASLEKKEGLIVKRSAGAAGSASAGKVKMDLQFGAEGSFLYLLNDMTNIQFKNRQDAFESIGKMILSGKLDWKDDYALVTEVKLAAKALIVVADSSNAAMEIECSADDVSDANFTSAVGKIEYTKDSDRVLKYEIAQLTPILFRAVSFTGSPPGGAPNSIQNIMKQVKEWFSSNLPKPELIYLRDYVNESDDVSTGIFDLPNGESITLSQTSENIQSFTLKSEVQHEAAQNLTVDKVQINQRSMFG